MAGKWDSVTKLLVRARPSQFASWLIPRSTLVAVLNVELTAAQFFADALLQVLIDGQLLALSEMLGGLAFTRESEKAQFKRRFAMYQDIMRESWVYQEILQEGEEKGLEKGREEGRKGLRVAIAQTVKQRFPALEDLALEQTARLTDFDTLNILLISVIAAQDEEAVRTVLLDADRK